MSDFIDNENSVVTIPILGSDKAIIVKQYELTDECIERVADTVVRKMMEAERERETVLRRYKMEVEREHRKSNSNI